MFGNKPTFGTATGFGAGTFGNSSTPFGQGTSAFGGANKPLGSTFSSQPFGSTQPATSIFGGAASGGSTSIFGAGASSFGQATTTPSSGFGFGASSTGAGLFGSSSQPNANAGLFSNASGSAFGTPKPTFGFGSSATGGSLFGQSSQQQPGMMFNQAGTGTSLFSGSAFGTSGTAAVGTSIGGTSVKFAPVTGSDTMMKNGTSTHINTRHLCITVMKEYENKSLEELRMEDYMANRKGPQNPPLGFGGTNQTSLFSSTTSAPGSSTLFGQNQNKSLFGGSAATGFGTSTSTGIFGQQTQQGISPFAPKPLTFGTPATTQGSTFNFGSQTAFGTASHPNKTMFGQTSLPPGSGLFSGTAAAQATPAFGSGMNFGSTFGTQSQNQPSPFTKPLGFGTAATTTAAAPFSFGANTTANTGSFSFTQKPPTSGFGAGFGVGTTGFSGFGSSANNSSNLFGQTKPQLGFSSGFGTGLNTSGGSFFGNVGNKPGGLGLSSSFGSGQSTGFGSGTGLGSGMTNYFGSSTAFGSDPCAPHLGQLQVPIQQQLLALATSPYGDSPLFRNILQDPSRKEDILKPTNPQAQKAFSGISLYKVTPRPTVKLKLKPINALNAEKSLFSEQDDSSVPVTDMFLPRRSVKKLVLKSKPEIFVSSASTNEVQANQDHEDSVSQSSHRDVRRFSPAHSPLFAIPVNRTVIQPSPNGEISVAKDRLSPSQGTKRFNREGICDDTMSVLNFNRARRGVLSPELDNSVYEIEDDDVACQGSSFNQERPHPSGIILRKPSYYSIPSLEELVNMVDDDGNCFVENLTVGREGYGNVYFPGITNVAKLNLDEIVHFRRKEVTIYPNDDLKPPIGQGLNKKAQITLDCVWPNDKSTHTPIKSLERLKFLNYQDKLEMVTSRLGAKFFEYRPETGSWVFQVNHFSKYGLEDSDDDEVPVGTVHVLQAAPPPEELLRQQQQLNQFSAGAALLSASSFSSNGGLHDFSDHMQRSNATSVPLRLRDSEEDEEMEGVLQQTFPGNCPNADIADPKEMFSPMSRHFAEAIGASANRVQAMKASFFSKISQDDEEEEEDAKSFAFRPIQMKDGFHSDHVSVTATKLHLSVEHVKLQELDQDLFVQRQKFLKLSGAAYRHSVDAMLPATHDMFSKFVLLDGGGISPEKLPKFNANGEHPRLVPLEKSCHSGKHHLLADFACFMGRSFRVGWGQNLTLVHAGYPIGRKQLTSDSHKLFQPFVVSESHHEKPAIDKWIQFAVVVEEVSIVPSISNSDCVSVGHIHECMEVQLHLVKIELEGDCPFASPLFGVDVIHRQAEIAVKHACGTSSSHPDAAVLEHSRDIWELMVALWGRLADGITGAYALQMARRDALSLWLRKVSERKISDEIENHNRTDSCGQLVSIFSHLTGLQIAAAIKVAQRTRDFSMSVLISQAGASCEVREIVQQQLDHWEERKIDRFISPERLKIYCLLSGCLVWRSSCAVVNACEGLDWMRALALHLWYHCPPMANICEAVTEYDKAYKGDSLYGRYATTPFPPFLEKKKFLSSECTKTEPDMTPFDMCYHLLKLYCDHSYPLDNMLVPTSYTSDVMDHRLSWFVYGALKALGYEHLSAGQSCRLHCNFASQLVSVGLWHWAIFVLLHIPQHAKIRSAVLDVLRRHICEIENNLEIEVFLSQKLLIPKEWIYEAKAIYERHNGNLHAEAFYLLKSGQWNSCHKLIMERIASDAVINENYEYLRGLLEELTPSDRCSTIIDWEIGGHIFLDYIHLSETVDRIRKGDLSAYELEGLQPEVTSLCNRVGNLQVRSAKDRLCISEMAKKTANLLRVVLSLGSRMTAIPSRLSVPHIARLPLPEDYGLQEQKTLTQSYFLEIT